jgi:hypothetical protein
MTDQQDQGGIFKAAGVEETFLSPNISYQFSIPICLDLSSIAAWKNWARTLLPMLPKRGLETH